MLLDELHIASLVVHSTPRRQQSVAQASAALPGACVHASAANGKKFRDVRLELARHEWARLKANDSLECRNCHQYALMDFTRQSVRAQNMHSTYLANKEKTCIDCHKGIAHRLPHIPPGEAPTDARGQVVPSPGGPEAAAPSSTTAASRP